VRPTQQVVVDPGLAGPFEIDTRIRPKMLHATLLPIRPRTDPIDSRVRVTL
jgi:hypothetical protein